VAVQPLASVTNKLQVTSAAGVIVGFSKLELNPLVQFHCQLVAVGKFDVNCVAVFAGHTLQF
jgi:hypothetical protein